VGPESNDLPYNLAEQPARELRAFDLQGSLVSVVKHILGQRSADDYFLSRATPDSLSRNGLIEYPHGEVLVSGFDFDGTQNNVTGYGPNIGNNTPAQMQVYIANATSTITSRPATLEYGNGVTSTWTYDDGPMPTSSSSTPSGAFGPDRLKTSTVQSSSGSDLSNRTYTWDPVGNLKQLNDSAGGPLGVGPYNAIYTYDDLRRVKSAVLTLPGALTSLDLFYDYDALGNLTLIDGLDALGNLRPNDGARQSYGRQVSSTCPAVPNSLPHALTQRTVLVGIVGTPEMNELCYDAAGRMIRAKNGIFTNTYKYFARNKVYSIDDRLGESRFLYDGNGTRVFKAESTGKRQIILSTSYREIFDPRFPGDIIFEAMYSGGGVNVARRELRAILQAPLQMSEPSWFSGDHLGGTNFVTDQNGHLMPDTLAFYRPFGGFALEPTDKDTSGNRLFTAKELDATGLYDFDARLYDPATGRFTQADEIQVGLDPQAQNRYSYVLNNPLTLVDPSGHQAVDHNATLDPSLTAQPDEWNPYPHDQWRPYDPNLALIGLPPPPLVTANEVWRNPDLDLEYVKVRIGPDAFGVVGDQKYGLGHWVIVTPQGTFGLGQYAATSGTEATATEKLEASSRTGDWRYRNPIATAATNQIYEGINPATGQLLPGWIEVEVYGPSGFTERVNMEAKLGVYLGNYAFPGTGTCQEFCTGVLNRAGAINPPATSLERYTSPEYNHMLRTLGRAFKNFQGITK